MLMVRRRFLVAVSGLALSAQAAHAQEATTPAPQDQAAPEKDIVVTGTRASLENAERTKRDSAVTVDGISADQIGQLPDVSISESLVRIPGVSSNDDPRGSGQVAIRGLGPDLVTTLVNGRLLPTTDFDTRRVTLGGLPTEGISAAYAQKTPEAATIEGGVAGILSLETIRPLETKRRGLTLAFRGLYGDTSDQLKGSDNHAPFGWRGEVTYVGKLSDTFGVSISYAGLKQFSGTTGYQLDGWRLGSTVRTDLNGDGTPDALPTNAGPILDYQKNERHSVLGTVQWDVSPAVRVTADGLYIYDLIDAGPARLFANGVYNGTNGAATGTVSPNSTVTSFTGNASLYRININDVHFPAKTFSGGLNVKIDNGGPIKATFDGSYSVGIGNRSAPQIQAENTAATAAAQKIAFGYDIRDPANATLTFQPLGASNYSLSQIAKNDLYGKDRIIAGRADFVYTPDALPLVQSIAFGARMDGHLHIKDQDSALWSWAFAARPVLNSSYLAYAVNPLTGAAHDFGGSTAASFPYYSVAALQALKTAPGVVFNEQSGTDYANSVRVNENTYALYAQANLLAGPLSGNLGARYVLTDSVVSGLAGTAPTNAVPQRFSKSYGFLLPSANLRLEATDKLIFRLAAAKTLSRPLYNQLNIGSGIDLNSLVTGTVPTITRGNPELKPFTAWGVDAGIEWYPSRSMTITLAGYYKWVSNFTTNTTVPTTITLPDGTTTPAFITTFINDPSVRHFRGIEVGVRRELDFLPGFLKNLGVQGNYAHNETDARDGFTSLVGHSVKVPPNNFAGDVVNAEVYYSTPRVDLRLAYRYFSPYTRGANQAFQQMPGGQFDLSGGFQLFRGIRAVGSVTNVFGTRFQQYVPDYRNLDNKDVLFRYSYRGRQVTFGIRAQLAPFGHR